jgi:hypothetical protein
MKRARADSRTRKRALPYTRIGPYERTIMEEISGSDLLVGFLFSAHSTARMFRIARKRACDRATAMYRLKKAVLRLKQKGLLHIHEEDSGSRLTLTQLGHSELRFLTIRTTDTSTWDGRWRVLFFDIPQTNHQLREELRGLLKRIGYTALQASVYIFPFDVPELVRLLDEKGLPLTQIAYTTCDKLPRDTRLRKHFKLV